MTSNGGAAQQELAPEVLAALEERPSSVAIVATVDAGGSPRTAPFGSVIALDRTRLRFGCDRRHATFANVLRDGRVSLSLLAPARVAVSIGGRVRVVKDRMECSPDDAVVEVAVEHVKNDWLPIPDVVLASGVTVSATGAAAEFMRRYVEEIRQA